jgi:hypothetical protein
MSVLGRPQKDWDDFLEETRTSRKRWRPSRILWIVAAVVLAAAVLFYYRDFYGG